MELNVETIMYLEDIIALKENRLNNLKLDLTI